MPLEHSWWWWRGLLVQLSRVSNTQNLRDKFATYHITVTILVGRAPAAAQARALGCDGQVVAGALAETAGIGVATTLGATAGSSIGAGARGLRERDRCETRDGEVEELHVGSVELMRLIEM